MSDITFNSNADPRIMDTWTAVGPDGPWNAITQAVSWPIQNITMLPALTSSNIFVEAAACAEQNSACPLLGTSLWTGILGDFSWMNSTSFDALSWDSSLEPLNLTGQGTHISDRVILEDSDQNTAYLDYVANTIDHDFTVNYPSPENWYTIDTGFFSLNVAPLNWTSVNGSSISLNQTLVAAYWNGAIPSISYGLHIGSASEETFVNGSLVLGGYDQSRCLTDPIESNSDVFTLVDIGMGVSNGGSPFPKAQDLPMSGLLRRGGSSKRGLDVFPNPGVPYLNLPPATCAAIADSLPVSFDDDFGLYIWNTSDAAFEQITSSPSYLSFTFSSAGQNSSIYVPFALLNLTLENPLVNASTSYFPCSPYTPSDGSTYHLGRAFLQAAFLAQNWQTQKLWLSQAPGPDASSISIKSIASTDDTITPMKNAPSWDSTWSSKLTALPMSTSSSNPTADITATNSTSGDLSGGEIAGVVIGALAGIAGVSALTFFLWRRKRNTVQTAQEREKWAETNKKSIALGYDVEGKQYSNPSIRELQSSDIVEMPTREKTGTVSRPVEIEGQPLIGELDGHFYGRELSANQVDSACAQADL